MADFTTSTHRAKWIFTPQALVMIIHFKKHVILFSYLLLYLFSCFLCFADLTLCISQIENLFLLFDVSLSIFMNIAEGKIQGG